MNTQPPVAICQSGQGHPTAHALIAAWAAAVFLALVQRHPLRTSIWPWKGSRDVKSEQHKQAQV